MGKRLFFFVLNILLITVPLAFSDDTVPVPADKSQVQGWFDQIVKPLSSRKGTLDPALEAAEDGPPKVIRVNKNGGGDFTTIADAVKSIPANNNKRVIVFIEGGEYQEKITIERNKPFVTFYGNPKDMPTMIFNGNAAKYTIVQSGTLTVDADYFVAANLHIKNSSPRPDGKMKDAQAAAMRIGGDKAAFYNVRFYGFQDTFCDDKGKHFFKDCYIEGTVDYIFGNGKSLYLNSEIHTIAGDRESWITAHARSGPNEDTGYVFLHCAVTGAGKTAYLGRAWMAYAKAIFAYSDLSDVVNPIGWHAYKKDESNLYFGEYENKGPGADMATRAPFTKKLTPDLAKPYLSLSYIEASKWLLPPPTL